MSKEMRFKVLLVLASVSFSFLAHTFTSPSDQLTGKIAFLRAGEVWVADTSGRNLRQLTNDSGKVDEFLLSPGLRYLAYARIIGSAEEPGLWDSTEPPPQRAIHSIVILDLQTKKKVTEIHPTRDPWIYISRWLPREKFIYYGADGFAVNGYYQYDPVTSTQTELPSGENGLLDADYSSDGLLKAYVNDTGLGGSYRNNLHLVHLQSNKDTTLVSRRGTICEQRISNGGSRIVFIEVERVGNGYFDNLWLCDPVKSSCISLHRRPAKPKSGGVHHVAWSPDDRYIGLFFPPEALVFDLQHPKDPIAVTGRNFCWIGNDRIALNFGNDLFVYDLRTMSKVLLIEKAEQPVFLR